MLSIEEREIIKNNCNHFLKTGVAIEGYSSEPLVTMLGGRVTEITEDGEMTAVYPLYDWQFNALGNMQGGVISTVIDNAIATLCLNSIGALILTINLDVNFFVAVRREDEEIKVRAKIENHGKKLLHIVCRVYKKDETLAAVATSNIMIFNREKLKK